MGEGVKLDQYVGLEKTPQNKKKKKNIPGMLRCRLAEAFEKHRNSDMRKFS